MISELDAFVNKSNVEMLVEQVSRELSMPPQARKKVLCCRCGGRIFEKMLSGDVRCLECKNLQVGGEGK